MVKHLGSREGATFHPTMMTSLHQRCRTLFCPLPVSEDPEEAKPLLEEFSWLGNITLRDLPEILQVLGFSAAPYQS